MSERPPPDTDDREGEGLRPPRPAIFGDTPPAPVEGTPVEPPTGPAGDARRPPEQSSESSGFSRFLQRTAQPSTIFGAAGIVAFGFLGSRLLGLLRSVAIAEPFGTDPELSAYWVAFRLPDLVFQLLAGATLSAAFIPTFARVVLRSEEEAWRLASSVLNLIAIATVVLAGLAFLFAPLIVPLLAPGLGEESGREAELRSLAVNLTRLMLLSPIFFGVSGMLTGILNARQHFAAPAFAPMVYNLSIILGAVLLSGPFGVHGLAWGVVIGSVGHMLLQIPALRGVGMRWTPSFELRSAAVRDVLRLMGPRMLGLAAAQVNFVVIMIFASFVSDAAISATNYAFLMAMLPVGVIGMAISTAVFPTLAQRAAAEELDALRDTLVRALRTILFLAIPASAGLALLAKPAVVVLLQRGAFGGASTDLVVQALIPFSIGVFALAGTEIVSRGFYAVSNTRTPVQAAVLAMVVNVALCAILIAPFGLAGLAAAATIAGVLEFALLVRLLHERLKGLNRRPLANSVLRTVAATAVMAQVVVLMRLLLAAAGADVETFGGALLVTAAAGGTGLLTYIGASYAFNREEYDVLIGRLGG